MRSEDMAVPLNKEQWDGKAASFTREGGWKTRGFLYDERAKGKKHIGSRINVGAVIYPVGIEKGINRYIFLVKNPECSYELSPLITRGVASEFHLWENAESLWDKIVFLCGWYPGAFDIIDRNHKPEPSGKFPHRCPKCGHPAYVGFTSIECSQRACFPVLK